MTYIIDTAFEGGQTNCPAEQTYTGFFRLSQWGIKQLLLLTSGKQKWTIFGIDWSSEGGNRYV